MQPAGVGVAGLRCKRGARELAEGRAAVGGRGGGREERRWVQPVAHDEQVAVAQAQRRPIEAPCTQHVVVVPGEDAQLLW